MGEKKRREKEYNKMKLIQQFIVHFFPDLNKDRIIHDSFFFGKQIKFSFFFFIHLCSLYLSLYVYLLISTMRKVNYVLHVLCVHILDCSVDSICRKIRNIVENQTKIELTFAFCIAAGWCCLFSFHFSSLFVSHLLTFALSSSSFSYSTKYAHFLIKLYAIQSH